MAGGSSSGAQKKTQRPVLPSDVAHAHAFAVVPTPGNPSSTRTGSSYFPLPTPPAPLRAFTLPQTGESTRDTEGTTSYPNSVASSQRDETPLQVAEKRTRSVNTSVPDASTRNAPRRSSEAVESTKTYTHSSASISGAATLQFATAAPFGIGGSPYISSCSSHSARSALSIAEIDCFFVQGSRSSTYSARSHSPRSRPVSEPAGLSDYSADPALSSNDETSDMWMSDQAERERQRAERLAAMRARKEAKEELRRQRRLARAGAVGELSAQTESTWREAIKSQGTMPLNDTPATRDSVRVRKRMVTTDSKTFPTAPAQTAVLAASADRPTLSGPGPPDHAPNDLALVDTLANDLTTSLAVSTLPSEILENPLPKDATSQRASGDPPTPPVLGRFDSDKTEISAPSRAAET